MTNPFTGAYENEPLWLTMSYHCDTCDGSWTAEWFVACDDTCPGCGAAVAPESSSIVLINGDVEPPAPVEAEFA